MQLIRYIFKNKSIAGAPTALQELFADELWKAVSEGYAENTPAIDFDTPDYDMLDALATDVVRFSSAKDTVMQKALYRELVDDTGVLRSYSQFEKAAYKIADTHVRTWLKAEYNLAITSAQAASKWVQIEKDAADLPLLQFDAVMDSSTTEICRNFNGITLPINHLFWEQYYIPNHFGERSLIRQLAEGVETDPATIVYPDKIPDIFKTNLAKQKKAFPPNHPYYANS